jgi:quinol monooxygenase YgiN
MKTKLLALVLSFTVLGFSYGANNSRENNMKTNVSEISSAGSSGMMITAKLTVKQDKVKEFISAAKVMIDNSNKEPGCKSYQLYQDPYDQTKFIFVEEYKDQAAVDAHFATEYFKAFGPKISGLVQEPAKIKIVTVEKEVNQ